MTTHTDIQTDFSLGTKPATGAATEKDGFTIVELMIATTVFGILMLIATGAVVLVTRQFHKGISMARTQEVARSVSEEISRNIQYSPDTPIEKSGDRETICTAGKLYAYENGGEYLRRFDDCTDRHSGPLAGGGQELLGKNMRIADLDITSVGDGFTVKVKVVQAPELDYLDISGGWHTAQCNADAGYQFCAVSDIDVTVFRRLN